MSKAKMTAREYALAYESLKSDMEILKTRIAMRLVTLAKRFPDAPVLKNGDTTIKAKSINNFPAVNQFEMNYQIELIGKIEDYVAEQNPIKQMKIDF